MCWVSSVKWYEKKKKNLLPIWRKGAFANERGQPGRIGWMQLHYVFTGRIFLPCSYRLPFSRSQGYCFRLQENKACAYSVLHSLVAASGLKAFTLRLKLWYSWRCVFHAASQLGTKEIKHTNYMAEQAILRPFLSRIGGLDLFSRQYPSFVYPRLLSIWIVSTTEQKLHKN